MPEVLRQAGAGIARAIFVASDAVFGPWTIALLFGTGIFLTFRLRLVQVVRFREAVRAMAPAAESDARGALSPFQSFMTALGATIGTGNIAGVATAVVSGGPGAVFWIWAYGFFATAIKFTEAVLGLKFRVVGAEGLSAGPMHYLRDGLKAPWLGWLYALVAGIAALTTTPFTQPNSIAVVWKSQFGVPTVVTGAVVAVLAWLVIIGGIRSIGRAAEKLAPLKVGLYLVGGRIVAVCAFLFGYTTLIGWAYYGEQFLEYIFGRRITVPYRWLYCLLIVLGAVGKVELVWAWGDLMNGLQIFPNLVGVLGLSGIAAAALRGQTPPART